MNPGVPTVLGGGFDRRQVSRWDASRRRWAYAAEQAAPILVLASDEASNDTGVTLSFRAATGVKPTRPRPLPT